MAFLTNLTILLVLACVSHQLMLASCQKSNGGRKGRGVDRGQHKERSGLKASRHPKSVYAQPIKGKMLTVNKDDCTWVATGEDLYVLSVTCKKGHISFSCEYVARPSTCKQYIANTELYWRQIARALTKQRHLCRDGDALVKAGMCRRAPKDAHFKLQDKGAAAPVKSCQTENTKRAEEFCSSSWSSICTFFFTMVQDYDC